MNTDYDAIIVGGGPGGSICARQMALAGMKVVLLEKDAHPKFHIGESILPRTSSLLTELGIADRVAQLPQLPKYGAEFAFGDDFKSLKFCFRDGLVPGQGVFNIERAHFDALLFTLAKEAGVDVREHTAVKSIVKLDDSGVEVVTAAGNLRGLVLMDASGHGTVVARHLGTRQNMADPELQKVAYFQHFEGVEQLPGDEAGYPGIIMCDEGWFWMIGLTKEKTSVGFVTRPGFVKTLEVPTDKLLQWAMARCPVVRHRMRNATGSATNMVLADFSYTCGANAGPGYFLVGDAGCFLDPIFSTGATLALMGGVEAARLATAMLSGKLAPSKARAAYIRYVQGSTGIFWRMIKNYYRHSFRELFMNGSGPLQVHRAVISTLAGNVFPRPPWCLRWRMQFFHFCVWAQQYLPLVPRRKHFSLLSQLPVELHPERPAATNSLT